MGGSASYGGRTVIDILRHVAAYVGFGQLQKSSFKNSP